MQGFLRYWTPEIRNLMRNLSEAESEKESKLKSIMQRLIGRFCEHHVSWRQLVSIAAGVYIDAKSLGHPVLGSDSLGGGGDTFFPNDVYIGGVDHVQ